MAGFLERAAGVGGRSLLGAMSPAAGLMTDLYKQYGRNKKNKVRIAGKVGGAAGKMSATAAANAALPLKDRKALPQSGIRGLDVPGSKGKKRAVLDRDKKVNDRLDDLEKESPF